MIKNILIASATKPVNGKTWEDLYNMIRAEAKPFNCAVIGGVVAPGPGCINLGLKIHGDNEKSVDVFGKAICMAMMPAKWGDTVSEIADGFTVEPGV